MKRNALSPAHHNRPARVPAYTQRIERRRRDLENAERQVEQAFWASQLANAHLALAWLKPSGDEMEPQ